MPSSSSLSRLCLHGVLASLVFSPLTSEAQEEPGKKAEKCMVWQFKGEKATVYIAGSIHVFKESDYPLPSPYEAAYEKATKLTFEIPPKDVGDPATAMKMQKAGMYPEGETLDDHLDEETLKAVDAFLKKSGLPAAMKRSRPWMFALVVTMMETMKTGAVPQHGIDHYFGVKANEDGKEIEGLETVAQQVSVFADLPEDVQKQMLKKTLEDLPGIGDQFGGMLAFWKSGDTEGLHKMMFEDADKFPDLMDALLIQRNKNWIDQLVGYIEGEEDVMVIVGAGHLAGKDSVIDLLDKKGFKGEQLSYVAAAKEAEADVPLKKD